MIRDLAIYGAGGFGREMALMVEQMNAVRKQWELVGFFDDGRMPHEKVDGVSVLGGVDVLNQWNKPLAVVVAVADPQVRQRVVGSIDNEKISFPVMVHPNSMPGGAENWFGRGAIITAGCILTSGIVLGEFVILNLSCTIGHDVRIGNYSSLMPGCSISGAVSTGEGSLIGTGAKILQNLSIGDNCKVGAGAVVTRSVAHGLTVVGVPAREIRHDKRK